MTAAWTLTLDVGAVHLAVSSTDTTVTLPAVLSGFRTGWATGDSDVWPVQPEPQVCVFSLLAASAADLAAVDLGTRVHAKLWAGLVNDFDYTPAQVIPSVQFAGVVGELSGTPVQFRHPVTDELVDGWRLDVQAVDDTADLGSRTVGGPWQTISINGAEPGSEANTQPIGQPVYASQWLHELLTQAGVPDDDGVAGSGAFWNGAPWPYGGPQMLATTEAIEPGPLSEAVEQVLRAVPEASQLASAGLRRGVLRPKLQPDGTLDPDLPYRVEWVSRRNPSTTTRAVTLPARFALLASGKYGPQLARLPVASSLIDATVIVSGDYVDRSVSWSRSKAGEPDQVTVTSKVEKAAQNAFGGTPAWFTTTRRLPGAAAVRAVVEDTTLADKTDAEAVGDMYLSATRAPRTVWQPQGFSWRASEDPDWPQWLSWFPLAESWLGWAVPVVITDVPLTQSPDGRPWQVGIPDRVDLVMEGGRFRFDFALRGHIPRPFNNNGAITCTNLRAEFPTLRTNQLDRGYTHADYRLVRSPALD